MNARPTIEERVRRLTPEQLSWITNELRLDPQSFDPIHQKELVAWVVGDSLADDLPTLRREMHKRLPSRLIPRRVIRTAAIPRTSTGKIDRKQLALRRDMSAGGGLNDGDRISVTERSLLRICSTLLGVADISPQDNFYHLGGDSMTSIQLISRARQAGIEIEPNDVLHCSSIAELAAASDRRIGNHCDDSLQESSAEPVVHKLRSAKGDETPNSASILMVHEVGGRCHYAHYLAAELASKKSLFVCNQPTHEQSPRSIVALATLYADAWIQTHATGPRIIVAFCWGGPLAYEIARQLKSRDVFVQAVLIVESGTEAAYRHACRRNRMWDRFKGLLVRARNRCGTLGSPAGVLQLYVTLQNKLLRRGVPITADAGFQFRDDEGDPVQIRSNVQAFLEYTIQPDEIAIHLFRVRGPAGLIGTKYSDTSLGWRYVVGPKLTLHDIPGDHDTCMKPPNVSVLARSMNHVIRELESIPNSPMPRKDSLS